jgi:hypothetical protein
MAALESFGLSVKIWETPIEVPDGISFEQDRKHATYDANYANGFWRILIEAQRVLKALRSRFIGTVRLIHFFWGDLIPVSLAFQVDQRFI